jgi:hypothetical protein
VPRIQKMIFGNSASKIFSKWDWVGLSPTRTLHPFWGNFQGGSTEVPEFCGPTRNWLFQRTFVRPGSSYRNAYRRGGSLERRFATPWSVLQHFTRRSKCLLLG